MVELASIRSRNGENMEDRYLFKAKRLDNGEWVQGNLIQSCDATDGWESIIIPVKNNNMFTKHIGHGYGNLGFENWYRVNPSTICQCTGLKDKNGKLIWENDIVDGHDKRGAAFLNCLVLWNESKARFDVRAKGCNFPMTLDEVAGDMSVGGLDYEVVGNRFDNPELLELLEV